MKRDAIEDNIAAVGAMSRARLKDASTISDEAPGKPWQHSFVTDNKTLCGHLADGESPAREHVRLSGVSASIDPIATNC
jgi:hypothetical protein